MEDCIDEFDKLMLRLGEGSDAAARELIELYGDQIYRAVRRKLNREMRSKFDSDDFVQAVWLSFFAHLSVITRIDTAEALMGFLVRVAHNKVIDECRRRLMSQQYNVNRERSIESQDLTVRQALVAQDPSPSDIVVAQERWDRLLEGLSNRDRVVLNLRLGGATQIRIAETLEVDVRTVQRVIQRMYQRLQEPCPQTTCTENQD